MSGIPFTQYFRPDGQTAARWIARPTDIEAAAQRFIDAGGNYTAEILRTGEVSLAAVKRVGGELRDVELIVCSNDEDVLAAVDSWSCSRSSISGEAAMTKNLLLILQARAEARAILFGAGEFDLYEALEPLFAFANTSGILDEIDAEAALGIIRDAFKGKAEI